MASRYKPAWVLGTAGLSVAKILENMEIGHNVMHGQWDWMNDPDINSQTWDWDTASPASAWRHSHNYVHHTYTNIRGKDKDLGYEIMRIDPSQKWHPVYLAQPFYNVLLMLFFEWGVALHDLDFDAIKSGEKPMRAGPRRAPGDRQEGRSTRSLKDYVLFPALSGREWKKTLAANFTANIVRNVWSNAMNWYRRSEQRYVEYGSSFEATRAFGLFRSLYDTVYNLNMGHLNYETPTLFERLADAGHRTACTPFLIYRGRTRHEVGLEGLLKAFANAAKFHHAVWGPEELFYGELYSSRKVDAKPTLARPATRDAYSAAAGRDLVEHDLYDFLLFSLPDIDYYSHRDGPEETQEAIALADDALAELVGAHGGIEKFLAAQRRDRRLRPRPELRRAPARAPGDPRRALAGAAAERAS